MGRSARSRLPSTASSGDEKRFPDGGLLLGSAAEAGLQLRADEGVAPWHAVIERRGVSFWLRDMGTSELGTALSVLVDDLSCPLHIGDRVLCETSPFAESGAAQQQPTTVDATLIQLTPSSGALQVWPKVAIWIRPIYTSRRLPICRELPQPRGLRKAYVGRLPTNMVPLGDIKAKRRHARLHVPGSLPGDRFGRIAAGTMSFVPQKGKPCLLLLGRHDHRWRQPHRLSAGDVFGVGRSLLRVLFVGTLDATGKVLLTEDDGSKFQRAQAKATKRQAKLSAQDTAELLSGDAPAPAAPSSGSVAGANSKAEVADATASGPDSGAASGDAEPEADEDEDEDEETDEDDQIVGDLAVGSAGMTARRALCDEAARTRPEPFVHLVYVGGPYRKREMRVSAPGSTIGSAPSNDILLNTDTTVSSLHAQIVYVHGAWWLLDNQSGRGTFLLVEDEGAAIQLGDVFRVARTELQVVATQRPYDVQ